MNVARAPSHRDPEMRARGWAVPTVLSPPVRRSGETSSVRVPHAPCKLPHMSCCCHFRGKSLEGLWREGAVAMQRGHLVSLRQSKDGGEGGHVVSLLPSPGWLGSGGPHYYLKA